MKPTLEVDKVVSWMKEAMIVINRAGGAPNVIDYFPDELIETMIRNDIHIVHCPPKDKHHD